MDLRPIEARADEFFTWVGRFDSGKRVDAAFASAADVPALIDEVKRLRAEVARLEEDLGDRTMDLAEMTHPDRPAPAPSATREEVIRVVAKADGQTLDGYTTHTAEMQYGDLTTALLARFTITPKEPSDA